jgi:ribosomal protein L37AE/L43A
MRKRDNITQVLMASINADGSGLYQCPFCQEWKDGEDKKVLSCDYCFEKFIATDIKIYAEAAKVIDF